MLHLATIHVSKIAVIRISFNSGKKSINISDQGISINTIKNLISEFYIEAKRNNLEVTEANTAFIFEFEV